MNNFNYFFKKHRMGPMRNPNCYFASMLMVFPLTLLAAKLDISLGHLSGMTKILAEPHAHKTRMKVPSFPSDSMLFAMTKEAPFSDRRGNHVLKVGELLTIGDLLSSPHRYHRKRVSVRGRVTRPELHLDPTEFFIDFVFTLKDGSHALVVFGRHDRTKGDIQIETDQYVEVQGIFWEERVADDFHFRNNLEAIQVTRYPSLDPRAL